MAEQQTTTITGTWRMDPDGAFVRNLIPGGFVIANGTYVTITSVNAASGADMLWFRVQSYAPSDDFSAPFAGTVLPDSFQPQIIEIRQDENNGIRYFLDAVTNDGDGQRPLARYDDENDASNRGKQWGIPVDDSKTVNIGTGLTRTTGEFQVTFHVPVTNLDSLPGGLYQYTDHTNDQLEGDYYNEPRLARGTFYFGRGSRGTTITRDEALRKWPATTEIGRQIRRGVSADYYTVGLGGVWPLRTANRLVDLVNVLVLHREDKDRIAFNLRPIDDRRFQNPVSVRVMQDDSNGLQFTIVSVTNQYATVGDSTATADDILYLRLLQPAQVIGGGISSLNREFRIEITLPAEAPDAPSVTAQALPQDYGPARPLADGESIIPVAIGDEGEAVFPDAPTTRRVRLGNDELILYARRFLVQDSGSNRIVRSVSFNLWAEQIESPLTEQLQVSEGLGLAATTDVLITYAGWRFRNHFGATVPRVGDLFVDGLQRYWEVLRSQEVGRNRFIDLYCQLVIE